MKYFNSRGYVCYVRNSYANPSLTFFRHAIDMINMVTGTSDYLLKSVII